MATRDEIIVILTGLEETCVRKERLTDVGVNAYIRLLRDIPAEVLVAASDLCSTTSKWYPTPADLREAAASLSLPSVPDSMAAWGEVNDQMMRVGHVGQPVFTHPLIGETVKRMGWRNLCLSESGNYDRHAFITAYEQLATRQKREVVMLPEVKELAKRLTVGSNSGETS